MTITTGQVHRVGFTGSRDDMTALQEERVAYWLMLVAMNPGSIWFHHGDCIGSDARAHRIAREYGYKIHLHPPLEPKYRAYLDGGCDIVEKPFSYHGRNKRIVKAVDLLLATPKSSDPDSGGGTWYTIHCAETMKRPHVIILPDGRVSKVSVV